MAHPGAIIKAKREAMGMSRRELAVKAGLNRSHLGRIERDEVDPRMSTVERIARILGLSILHGGVRSRTSLEDATVPSAAEREHHLG